MHDLRPDLVQVPPEYPGYRFVTITFGLQPVYDGVYRELEQAAYIDRPDVNTAKDVVSGVECVPLEIEPTREYADLVVKGEALADMARPEACLSPAVCYHIYHRHHGATLPGGGLIYQVRGKCFRYEASNLRELTRLWDFTMRELVFLGLREGVLEQRERGVKVVGAFFDELGLAAEIRTASDPFYIAPDAAPKTYFQLTAETKYEVSALLPEEQRLAVGSLNYHTDFFGRAFEIDIEGAGRAHSVCIAFGLERLVWAFLAQHGTEPAAWPEGVRAAIRL